MFIKREFPIYWIVKDGRLAYFHGTETFKRGERRNRKLKASPRAGHSDEVRKAASSRKQAIAVGLSMSILAAATLV